MDVDGDPWSDEESVVCIPFSPESKNPELDTSTYPSANVMGDLPYGDQQRYSIYSEAWQTLNDQLKAAARQTYGPILANVLDIIKAPAKEEEDTRKQWVRKLMPARELSVALVVGDDKQEIFDEIASEVIKADELALSTLMPSHFTSLQVTLKALVEGFIRGYDDKKRRASTALAAHDLQLLCSWYSWLSRDGKGPRLVVLIQDIEICNASVVHDLFHICSNYAEQLPFTFIIGASSSNVMTTMFPRATRTLLSVKRFLMPNEHQMFEFLMQELFFNVNGFPQIILSGKAVSWLYHSWSSYHASLSALISHFQLIYIRHFQNPLSILWSDHTMGTKSRAEWKKLAKTGATQLLLRALTNSLGLQDGGANIEEILEAADNATARFRDVIQEATYGFLILREVQGCLRALSAQQHAVELSSSFVRLAEEFGDGKLDETCSRLLKRIRLLDRRQLHGLLERIKHASIQNSETGATTQAFLEHVDVIQSALLASQQTNEEARMKHSLSEDLATALSQLWESMNSWRTLPLSQVWRTSDMELPIDILNPSIRSSILTSLMQPGDYLLHDLDRYTKASSKRKVNGKARPKTDTSVNPDICILFSRYANAGRTINVYDWFESFVQGVEATQPRKLDKVKGKETMKGKGTKPAVVDEQEAWRREVYGRFMWAIHEMDMLGLLRWNGRGAGKKGAECAGKVVWVIPE